MEGRRLFSLSVIFLSVLCFFTTFSSAIEVEYNLTYDTNGNLIQGFDKYLEYDDFNRLIEIRESDENGAVLEQYFYDSSGNRIKKITYNGAQNETTYYIDKSFVQVVNNSGTFNYTYYYADDLLLVAKDPSGKKQFYHPDHLGSTNLITNESGDIVENTFYSPYGEVASGGQESRYLFTGKELDRKTDFYYYGARYYNPAINHFVQPDSQIQDIYNPQDLNRYSYTRNNPYKYTDPSGNAVNLATGLIGAGIGSVAGFGISIAAQIHSTGQVNWADASKDAAAGFVAGGVTGLTFGAGAALLGGELSSGALIAMMGTSGGLGSGAGQVTSNILYDRPLSENVPQATVSGAAFSVVTAGAIKGGSVLFKSSSSSIVARGLNDKSIIGSWDQATFSSSKANLAHHYNKYVIEKGLSLTPAQYTARSQALYDNYLQGNLPSNAKIQQNFNLKGGGSGVKITSGKEFGIYTSEGKTVTYGGIDDIE